MEEGMEERGGRKKGEIIKSRELGREVEGRMPVRLYCSVTTH